MPVTKKRTKKRSKAPAPRVQMLPLKRLHPSTEDGRRPVSANSLKSLARSIKKSGVLQPILVRTHPTKRSAWEIRAGYRRWRAAAMAGLEYIPAIVRSLNDESALTVTITENLQRENLHPLEEAAVIQRAFDNGYDVQDVASRLGKTPQFVARRAALTRLAEVWRKAVRKADSPASRLSPAHLELIARLPEETQLTLAEDDFFAIFGRGFPTVPELQRIIDGGLQSLTAMPWSPDDETLDPKAGACLTCTKRSGARPMLFDAEDAPKNGKPSKSDRCLDPGCFDRKQIAHVQRCESELRSTHPKLALVQIGGTSMSPAAHEAFGERVRRIYAPMFVKPSNPNAVPAMQVDGPKAGKLVYVDGGGPEVSGADGRRRGSRPKAERKPATLEERQARHHKRRQAFVVKQVDTQLRELSIEDVSKALTAKAAKPSDKTGAFEVVSLLLSFGTSNRADRGYCEDPWDKYDRLCSEAEDGRAAAALHDVIQIWVRRLAMHDSSRVEFQAAEARRMCEIVAIDYAEIEAEAVRALPQPKSWGLPPEDQVSEPHSDASEADADPPPPTEEATAKPARASRSRRDRTPPRRISGRSKARKAG